MTTNPRLEWLPAASIARLAAYEAVHRTILTCAPGHPEYGKSIGQIVDETLEYVDQVCAGGTNSDLGRAISLFERDAEAFGPMQVIAVTVPEEGGYIGYRCTEAELEEREREANRKAALKLATDGVNGYFDRMAKVARTPERIQESSGYGPDRDDACRPHGNEHGTDQIQ